MSWWPPNVVMVDVAKCRRWEFTRQRDDNNLPLFRRTRWASASVHTFLLGALSGWGDLSARGTPNTSRHGYSAGEYVQLRSQVLGTPLGQQTAGSGSHAAGIWLHFFETISWSSLLQCSDDFLSPFYAFTLQYLWRLTVFFFFFSLAFCCNERLHKVSSPTKLFIKNHSVSF